MSERIARASMLMRCAAADAFGAFVDPEKITRFWLHGASGPLARDARVTWQFMVPGATETVQVTEFEDGRRIAFVWSSGLAVAIDFVALGERATRVEVTVTGFADDPAGLEQIVDVTEGFSIVLCDLKTLLELGRSANMVRDKAELITSALLADATARDGAAR